jgi:hypothetical protein
MLYAVFMQNGSKKADLGRNKKGASSYKSLKRLILLVGRIGIEPITY